MKIFFIPVGALAGLAFATSALAQQSVRLSAGFVPDPVSFDVYSGGSNSASDVGCVGAVGDNPDVQVTYDSAGGPLSFGVYSEGDTSLVINGPDGRYYCNDDANGVNPMLGWDSAPSGTYDIWVGAVGSPAPATLIVTEGSVFGD